MDVCRCLPKLAVTELARTVLDNEGSLEPLDIEPAL